MKKAALFILTVILISSCSKEGPAGPAGPAGKDGTANILTYTSVASWTYSSTNNIYYYNYGCIGLSQKNIDYGVILAYGSTNSTDWFPIPVVLGGDQYTFVVSNQLIQYQCYSIDGTTVTPINNLQVKVVIIPPSQMKPNSDINFKNYSEVKEAFNLE